MGCAVAQDDRRILFSSLASITYFSIFENAYVSA